MRTTPDQLQQWLSEPEGARLEFKEAKSRYDFEKLLQYCVALANEGGVEIVPARLPGMPGRSMGGYLKRAGGDNASLAQGSSMKEFIQVLPRTRCRGSRGAHHRHQERRSAVPWTPSSGLQPRQSSFKTVGQVAKSPQNCFEFQQLDVARPLQPAAGGCNRVPIADGA